MKTSLSLTLIFSFLFLSSAISFSNPLNGTYSVGSGGNYPTINSALDDAYAEGIDGPIIFDIITGIYIEIVSISNIPGSSLINTLTLKSQTGNPTDVIVNIPGINTSNIFICDLSIDSYVSIGGNNINIINNDLRNHYIGGFAPSSYHFHDINIIGNKNISSMSFAGDGFVIGGSISKIRIKNNFIDGDIGYFKSSNELFENNTIIGNVSGCTGKIAGNKITGNISFYTDSLINNFIIGNATGYVNGIGSYNTIVGGSLTTPTLEILSFSKLFNNILINPNGGTVLYNSYATYFISDYNDLYNGGSINLINNKGLMYNNVSDFYIATGLEQHSTSIPVTFQSPTDLHLAGPSIGDLQLVGIPIPSVLDDIDGQLRNLTHPYKGADEVDFPLPVELVSFTYTVTYNSVMLNWTTVSELNNSGFEIERSTISGQWSKVNFIKGHGNSNTAQNYSFEDKNLSSGKYNYRLKQIDFNGNFEYYNLAGVVVIGLPKNFSLSQNYPNPFNPNTIINYQLANNSDVSLKIYDISGREVLTLINEFKTTGSYEVNFNGSNFASGVYYYKIIAGNFTSIKKMLLIK